MMSLVSASVELNYFHPVLHILSDICANRLGALTIGVDGTSQYLSSKSEDYMHILPDRPTIKAWCHNNRSG